MRRPGLARAGELGPGAQPADLLAGGARSPAARRVSARPGARLVRSESDGEGARVAPGGGGSDRAPGVTLVRVLVTGGNRYIGLDLVFELARRGHDVTVINSHVAPLPDGAKRIHADRR